MSRFRGRETRSDARSRRNRARRRRRSPPTDGTTTTNRNTREPSRKSTPSRSEATCATSNGARRRPTSRRTSRAGLPRPRASRRAPAQHAGALALRRSSPPIVLAQSERLAHAWLTSRTPTICAGRSTWRSRASRSCLIPPATPRRRTTSASSSSPLASVRRIPGENRREEQRA